MDCRQLEEKLHALADGNASREDEASLRRHLETCPECSDTYAGIVRLKDLVRRSERPPVPAALIREVRRNLEDVESPETARGASSKEPRPRRRGRRRPLRWIAAALVVLSGLGALVVAPGGWFDVPLAHARVLRGCSKHYGILDKKGLDPVLETADPGYRNRVRRDSAGLLEGELEWVPFLKNASYCGASPYHCPDTGHRLGVRLDYMVRTPDAPPRPLCIYVVRLENHPLAEKLRKELGTGPAREHACDCIEEADSDQNHTIYCWISDGLLYTFVSNIRRRVICKELGPHLCNQP